MHVNSLTRAATRCAVLLVLGTSALAYAGDNAKTAVGTGVGAAAGAAIGDALGGKTGGIIGGAVGGAVGGAATTKGRGSEKAGAMIGGAAGGAGGAAVGYSQGGSTGGVVGAGLGGAVGSVVGKNVADKVPAPPPPPGVVIGGSGSREVREVRVVERVRVEEDDHRHKRRHKRGKHCDDDHPGRGHAYGKYKDCD